MVKKIERTIESIPKLSAKPEKGRVILKIENLLTEKPRASVKEIDDTYKLIKILKNAAKFYYKPPEVTGK